MHVNPIRSLLLKVKVFDLNSMAPFGVKILVIGLSWISRWRWFLCVVAAVLILQMSEPGVVVRVDEGQMHLRKIRSDFVRAMTN